MNGTFSAARHQGKGVDALCRITGVLLIGLSLLMLVSLVSHSPEDPPNSSRPAELSANLAGWLGAHLSYYLLFFVGYGAYAVTALTMAWGWNRFRRTDPMPLARSTALLLAMMVIFCSAAGVPSRGRTPTAFVLGGSLGVALSSTVLVPFLGRVGSGILLGTLLLVLLILATNIPFHRIPDLVVAAARWTRRVVGRLAGSGWRGSASAVTWVRGAIGDWRLRRRIAAARRKEIRDARKAASVEEAQAMYAEIADDTAEDAAYEDTPVSDVEEESDLEPEDAEPEGAWETPDVATPEPTGPAPKIAEPFIEKRNGSSGMSLRSTTSRKDDDSPYLLPTMDLLEEAPAEEPSMTREMLLEGAQRLEKSLSSFNIDAKVVQVNPGPVITAFEVEPPPGIKVSKIVGLADDLALVMKARTIRIQAPIPGKAAVGIEVPNPRPSKVYLRDILESEAFQEADGDLMMGLGKTTSGEPFITDLARMPHLLIAGATGAGKSVCINALISSILFRRTLDEVRFLMVDPKMLELSIYDRIPHLLAPVVTDPKLASDALKWAVTEMEVRYRTLSRFGVRNIADYNRKLARMRREAPTEEDREEVVDDLCYIIVIIDELADLMMTAPADIEDSLARLAQMARAVGIHLILATQRPSVNVITGKIKANFPSRIAFRVASKVDSRTILDSNGAEKLLGQGDMLFMNSGRPDLIRVHGAFISTEETQGLVDWVAGQGLTPDRIKLAGAGMDVNLNETVQDDRFDEALRLVVAHQQGSASLLQRRMSVGYARAARLIDQLEDAGIVTASDGSSKPREVLLSEGQLAEMEQETAGER